MNFLVLAVLFSSVRKTNAFQVSQRVTPMHLNLHKRQIKYSLDTIKTSGLISLRAGAINAEIDEPSKLKIEKNLRKDFISIAIPALIQLTAEPLASLVDTAYLGRLGPEILGGAGVAISAQYAVSKLYNDPLLRTSISLVATQDGKKRASDKDSDYSKTSDKAISETKIDANGMSVAVSSALLLALVVGLIQAAVYFIFASRIIRSMGVSSTSAMYHSAYSYLKVRALGTPAATLWLVTNGIYRGMGNTKTPLVFSLFFTAMNAILDPIFIFTLKFGASGAAAGTALAQYLALFPLMLRLNREVNIDILGQLSALKDTLKEYLKAGVFVFTRTVAKVLAYAVCAKEAALLGTVAAAAYNLTFQLGFATTQICESCAVAVQTLLARELADESKSPAKTRATLSYLIKGSIAFGGFVALSLSLATYLKQKSIIAGLTTNPSVQAAAESIFPAVLVTQVLKGLAYPVNGIIMGGLDWKFTMLAMWIANAVCVGMLKFGGVVTLNKIWWALAAFMGVQVVSGILRFLSHTGVWSKLATEKNRSET